MNDEQMFIIKQMGKHKHTLLYIKANQRYRTRISGYTCSALLKAFVGDKNTWSTCPSGVVLSSLSSAEAEQPFFTLFGLSFRDQNKTTVKKQVNM